MLGSLVAVFVQIAPAPLARSALQAEILLNFFVGYTDEDGVYVDDLGMVARHYLGSFWLFWFDAITSIPFSLIDYRVAQARAEGIFWQKELDLDFNQIAWGHIWVKCRVWL